MARSQYAIDASVQFVPANRTLFGADDPDKDRGFTGPKGIEKQLGKTMGVRNRHYSWNAPVATIDKNWSADAKVGAVPMISLGGQGYSPGLVKEIAAGKHDAYWRSMFQALAGQPGLFRPWMEMNGAHNAYNADATAFIAMWKHVYGVAMNVPNLRLSWIFCPQAADPQQVWPRFWPGSQFVQWMGIDLYRHVFSFADPWRQWAIRQRKPFCVCESGFEQNKRVTDPITKTVYDKDGTSSGHSLIEQHRQQVKAHPNVVMYLVWNAHGPIGTNYVDTSQASLTQYRNFTKDPFFKFG